MPEPAPLDPILRESKSIREIANLMLTLQWLEMDALGRAIYDAIYESSFEANQRERAVRQILDLATKITKPPEGA